MGLACSQIRLLTLTRRKADCEYNISINSMEKMALTREQSELSKEYQSKLKSKQLSYYANGQYDIIDYGYLMGYGVNYSPILSGSQPLKSDNSMILTDNKGRVVLSDSYAKAITSVLGAGAMDTMGRGATFSVDQIPQILDELIPGYSLEDIQAVINDKTVSSSYEAHGLSSLTGEETGSQKTIDNSDTYTKQIQTILDFYYPIFQAAAANGWTTEYNNEIKCDDMYVNDAIISGVFNLAQVDYQGNYKPDTSLTFFLTNGAIQERIDSDVREEITAWYNTEKEELSEKESWLDLENQDLSTELEAINAEIQSVQSLIDDGMSVFEWGS